jgi:NADP-dependent 3-hydroxy acid dehydrogenase YdfG
MGRATAQMLAAAGAKLFVHGRKQNQVDHTLALVRAAGGIIEGTTADIAKPEDVERVFAAAEACYGGVDVWINSAAVGWNGSIDGSADDPIYALATNLTGAVCGAKAAVTRFRRTGSGCIILIGSMSAEVREARSSVYVAAKMGVRGFSIALRKELGADGIGVHLIEPGACSTELSTASEEEKVRLVRENLMMIPEDIAEAVFFILTRRPGCDVITMQVRPSSQLI